LAQAQVLQPGEARRTPGDIARDEQPDNGAGHASSGRKKRDNATVQPQARQEIASAQSTHRRKFEEDMRGMLDSRLWRDRD